MMGVATGAPSSVVDVSTAAMSRSTRGRSRRARQAMAFSATVISSSAPACTKAKAAADIFALACASRASKSMLSIWRFPAIGDDL